MHRQEDGIHAPNHDALSAAKHTTVKILPQILLRIARAMTNGQNESKEKPDDEDIKRLYLLAGAVVVVAVVVVALDSSFAKVCRANLLLKSI